MPDWKWLQVRMPSELLSKFHAHAVNCEVGMSEIVRGWIEDEVEPKAKVPTSKPVPSKPVDTGIYSGVCSECGAVNVKTTINNKLKEVCYECAMK